MTALVQDVVKALEVDLGVIARREDLLVAAIAGEEGYAVEQGVYEEVSTVDKERIDRRY